MRNYISVNAKYYKKVEIDRISSHNFRQSKIDYLLDKTHVKFQNQHIIYHENMQEDIQNLDDLQRDILLKNQFANLLKSKDEVQRRRKCYGNKNSNDLALALQKKAKIIITTIQKFAYAYKKIDSLDKNNYAIIIDEAHSSTSGENINYLK